MRKSLRLALTRPTSLYKGGCFPQKDGQRVRVSCPFCNIQKKGTGENPDTFPGAEGETRRVFNPSCSLCEQFILCPFLLRKKMDEEFESLCPFCIIQKKGTGENPDTFSGAEGETRTLAPVTRPTPLAGAPRHQLEYFCIGSVYDTIRLLKERAENPLSLLSGGESGIRTHGTLPYGSFQDCFLKPLGHLSLWTLALRRVECLFTLPDLRCSVKPLCKFFLFSVR